MDHKMLSELRSGEAVEGFYILRAATPKTTAAGKPFLSAVLSDKSGQIDAKVWDYAGPIAETHAGKVVKVRGTVGEYRGSLQLTAERIRLAEDSDPVEPEELVAVAPIDAEAAEREVEELLRSLADEDYRRVALALFARHREKFSDIPAAKSVHHGFLHGLLMHTLQMLRLADFLAEQYKGTVSRDLLLCGTFAHDLQKEKEFVFSELGLVTDYSVAGQLLGHLVMGAREVAQIAGEEGVTEEKSLLLQHMVLSHHGEPDFGAAVRPQCAEAELLSLIDMVDSRMEIYRETYADMAPGSFSGRVFALDKRVYRPGV